MCILNWKHNKRIFAFLNPIHLVETWGDKNRGWKVSQGQVLDVSGTLPWQIMPQLPMSRSGQHHLSPSPSSILNLLNRKILYTEGPLRAGLWSLCTKDSFLGTCKISLIYGEASLGVRWKAFPKSRMREDSTHLGVLWGIWRRFDVQVRSGFPPDPSRSCTRRPRSCCSANTASWERRFNVYYMLGAISNSGLTCCFRRTVEREPARWAAGRRCSRRSPTSTSSRGWYTPTRAGTSAVSSISCCKRREINVCGAVGGHLSRIVSEEQCPASIVPRGSSNLRLIRTVLFCVDTPSCYFPHFPRALSYLWPNL